MMDLQEPPWTCPFYPSSVLSLPIHKKTTAYALYFLLLLVSSLVLVNVVDPSHALSPSQILSAYNRSSSEEGASTLSCDFSYGRWVWDEAAMAQSYTEDCQFLDPGFQCHRNGRVDSNYLKWRWQPHGCHLPRFNASGMLEKYRNSRIVFAGDSIGRNQWESLLCMLSKGVQNQSTIYEQNGSPITKHKGFLSIKFHDHNLTVEYYRVPFLVVISRPPQNSSQQINKAIRVDQLHWYSKRWIGADVFVFNAGHWWNQDKTVKMGYYFQEGGKVNMTMDIREAFRKTLQTWKQWVDENLQHGKNHVFFRSYAPSHFRGGTWDEGGRCDQLTWPETNYTELEPEPWNNEVISETIEQIHKGSEMHVKYLNITYLTEFRKDGHPSNHREPGTPPLASQDCSHWCLPGTPDVWNELLYAYLMSNGYDRRRKY